ncbi:Ca2+-binding protein, EF-hand superfamily [Syntrophus gentianae]|uniref:Ca2+-binding protein, EF-hand superfamily n=1 Tax=Syntrophus gentianae TaxID=43775 RepID=A0A1H7YTK8_9BACT|nr:EF-hand domain-containing protein [Syntrophus gentianae]SEM49204.1 Ca2+-binding protein, EF-hand superfamily [Syntrophus gentianae]
MVSGISSSSNSISEMWQQMFSKIDTDSDGSINNSEVSAIFDENSSDLASDLFSSLDTDQDSLISSMEFNSGLAQLNQERKQGMGGMEGTPSMGAASAPPPPDQVFETADADEDGVVTEDELASVIGSDGTDIESLFEQIDTDGDGSITQSEDEAFRAQMMETTGQSDASSGSGSAGFSGMAAAPPPPPPDQVFDTADADEDGVVTEDELASVIGSDGTDVESLFEQIDTDGDGSITRTEDETFREQMAEMAGQGDTSSSSEASSTSNDIADWTSRLVSSLLQSLNAYSYSSGSSTSTDLVA